MSKLTTEISIDVVDLPKEILYLHNEYIRGH